MLTSEGEGFTIPLKLPEASPEAGRWVAYSNALISKIVAQGDDKEVVLLTAQSKGCKPPILLMRSDWRMN